MDPNPPASLENFQFTFETYLDSNHIQADSNYSPRDTFDSRSLSESILTFREQFGRTYHGYRAGSYLYPNDAPESDRLDEQYEIIKEAMDGQLHFAPFTPANPPRKVLDIATGTGTWAIEFGDDFPEASITATDLSPIQPGLVPPNVSFFVEDATEEWDFTPDFDYIHTRVTLGCWKDMKSQIIQRAFDNLRPGGWLECQEFKLEACSDDSSIPADFPYNQWAHEMASASSLTHRQLDVGEHLKTWFQEVGFVDVHEAVVKVPLGGWPKDLRLKHLGMLWQSNIQGGLSGFTLGLGHQVLGKTVEEIEVSLVEVRRSLLDPKLHAFHKFYVVWGRKPE